VWTAYYVLRHFDVVPDHRVFEELQAHYEEGATQQAAPATQPVGETRDDLKEALVNTVAAFTDGRLKS
jgi:hypothetical protein